MVAGTHELDRTTIQEEAVVAVYGERAEADTRRVGVEFAFLAALVYADKPDFRAVQLRLDDIPTLGVVYIQYHVRHRLRVGGAYTLVRLARRDELVPVVYLGGYAVVLRGVACVFDCRLAVDRPVVRGAHIELGLKEESVVRDVQLLLDPEPDVTIYARALVPPALGRQTVDVDDKDVDPLAEERAVGDVDIERRVCRERASDERAVEVDARGDRHALERQEDMLSGVLGGYAEGLPVPRVVTGLVAVRQQVVFIEVGLGEVVVRQVDDPPVAVVEAHVRDSALLSGFGRIVRIRVRFQRVALAARRAETSIPCQAEIHVS